MNTQPDLRYLRLAGWDGRGPITQELLRRAEVLRQADALAGRPPLQAPQSILPSVPEFPPHPAGLEIVEFPRPQAPPPTLSRENVQRWIDNAEKTISEALRPAPPDAPNVYSMQDRINRAIESAVRPMLPQIQLNIPPGRFPGSFAQAESDIRNALSWLGLNVAQRRMPEGQPVVNTPVPNEPPPLPVPPEMPPVPPARQSGGSGGGAASAPTFNIPAPNWDAVREMFRRAAPQPPDTDPREKWIIGLIGAMLGAQQNPGERLGAMFARMAGAGAQAGINVRREDRQKEDAFRREQQQHAMNLAGLEAKIAEAEWNRMFNEWKTREQLGIEREKLGVLRDNAALRAALIAASLGTNVSPEMLLSGVVDRAASGQILLPGLPPEKLREEAMKLIEQRDRNAFLMLRSGVASNPTLRDVYNSAVRQVIINHLASLPDDQRTRLLNAYRGALETRPRPGRIPELAIE